MPTISLTQGKRSIVDWQDYQRFSEHRWFAVKARHTCYAGRYRPGGGLIYMHREILGLPSLGRGVMPIDHIDRNGLNNRRRNLRCTTSRKNSENRRNPSPHGVGIAQLPNGKFIAKVWADGVRHYLGVHPTAREAREVRSRFLIELQG